LSPASQIAFLQLLQRLEAGGKTQFIIATHSPILLAYPGAQIFSFGQTQIKEVQYEDTSHYRIYRGFMQDPQAFLSA
jgi:predicted ATPase